MQRRKLTCGSLFSGIAGFDEGFRREGFETKWFVEREPFCHSVLTTHFPNVPIFNDVLTVGAHNLERVDCITGGFPCQDLSVAGERAGLAGARSGLFFEFARVVAELKPKWFVCENVPGLFSSSEGRDFDLVIEAFSKLGYGVAWRTLDSQFFGVAQRRRRVFIVGCLGDGRRAAEILFEPKGVCRDHPPRREKGERVAPTISSRPSGGGGLGTDFDCDGGLVSGAVSSKWAKGTGGPAGDECYNLVTHSLRADGFDASEDGTGRETPIVPIAFNHKASAHQSMNPGEISPTLEVGKSDGVCVFGETGQGYWQEGIPPLRAEGDSRPSRPDHVVLDGAQGQAVAFAQNQRDEVRLMDVVGALASEPGMKQQTYIHGGMAVRRLTPVECERLQSFPDNWTNVLHRGKPAADGPRYKALGNAVSVNVIAWIAKRIVAAENIV